MDKTTNVIKLLPEYVANQIAAGEVVQRPSNIVKELLENSIDAGARHIVLNLQHGGKTLVEVIDNGYGIGTLDARMAFERHATSKIKSIDDLYSLRTMGFRGEALASIAAVAKVEMMTQKEGQDIGTHLVLDKGEVISQSSIQRETGTTISVKNLFFHVPARKHFLKSDPTELKHIVTEFIRIALAYPEVSFVLNHHQETLYQLSQGNLKQRIIQLFGKSYEQNILGLKEETDNFAIEGYISKPSLAKKTTPNHYLIVNRRFVRCPIIHRAILNAYGTLIARDEQPFYVLFLDLDPKTIDINIHPSKQEIKFSDERWIFAFVQSHIKYTLAKNNIDQPMQFDLDHTVQSLPIIQTAKNTQSLGNSQLSGAFSHAGKAHYLEVDWKKEIENLVPQIPKRTDTTTFAHLQSPIIDETTPQTLRLALGADFYVHQLLRSFLLVEQNETCVLIDQQAAHEAILYHHISHQLSQNETDQQEMTTLLEPILLGMTPTALLTIQDYETDLRQLGFQVEQVGLTDVAVYGFPSFIKAHQVEQALHTYLEHIENSQSVKGERTRHLSLQWAKSQSIKKNETLSPSEQQSLVSELLKLPQYQYAPDGTPILKVLDSKDVLKWLRTS